MGNKDIKLPNWFRIMLSLSLIYMIIIFFYLSYKGYHRFHFKEYLIYVFPLIFVNLLTFLWKDKINLILKKINKEKLYNILKQMGVYIFMLLLIGLLLFALFLLDNYRPRKYKSYTSTYYY